MKQLIKVQFINFPNFSEEIRAIKYHSGSQNNRHESHELNPILSAESAEESFEHTAMHSPIREENLDDPEEEKKPNLRLADPIQRSLRDGSYNESTNDDRSEEDNQATQLAAIIDEPYSIPSSLLRFCPPTCLLTNHYNLICQQTKQFLFSLQESGKCLSYQQVKDGNDRVATADVYDDDDEDDLRRDHSGDTVCLGDNMEDGPAANNDQQEASEIENYNNAIMEGVMLYLKG